MRRMAMALALGALLFGALPAHAQDILGLGLRPTDAMPDGTSAGMADIKRDGDGFRVSVNLESAADSLKLADFAGAAGFVLWAVDMDGNRHNLGALGDDFAVNDVVVDFMVARLYVTAESNVKAVNPGGDRLFQVTLRSVQEVEAAERAADAPEDTEEADEASSEGDTTEEAEDSKPAELPTTGNLLRDLLVLVAVASALIIGGARLRHFAI